MFDICASQKIYWWVTKPAVFQNNLQAYYLKNTIIWNKSKQTDIKLKTEKNFHGDVVNVSTGVASGEIKDGKKNKKMLTVSDIPFSVANSQSVYCLLLSWSELVFFQKNIFPLQTLCLQ